MCLADWLAPALPGMDDGFEDLRRAALTGRPCGGMEFIQPLERQLGRRLDRDKPGPKPRRTEDHENQLDLFKSRSTSPKPLPPWWR